MSHILASSAPSPATEQTATRVLQIGTVSPLLEPLLAAEFDVLRLPSDDVPAFLAEHGSAIEVAVTSGHIGMSGDVIRALPNLRAIVNHGVGYDAVDVAAARERGVVISNTPDVLTDCVADLAVGLFIDVLRGVSAADRFVRRGAWGTEKFPLATKVSGRRVGILGLGRIGSAIARRLEGFDTTISYHNRSPVAGVGYDYVGSVEELAAINDVLIVAAAGGADSAGLVSRQVLRALGPDGYLINVARGSVVDEDALVEALEQRTIKGAGLDVFASEPRVPAALRELDSVVLLPHIASGTVETRQAMADLVMANLRQFCADGTLLTRAE
jgi:lactate dehydrogenase-like 2-hydroxyacid dehydrogenase